MTISSARLRQSTDLTNTVDVHVENAIRSSIPKSDVIASEVPTETVDELHESLGGKTAERKQVGQAIDYNESFHKSCGCDVEPHNVEGEAKDSTHEHEDNTMKASGGNIVLESPQDSLIQNRNRARDRFIHETALKQELEHSKLVTAKLIARQSVLKADLAKMASTIQERLNQEVKLESRLWMSREATPRHTATEVELQTTLENLALAAAQIDQIVQELAIGSKNLVRKRRHLEQKKIRLARTIFGVGKKVKVSADDRRLSN